MVPRMAVSGTDWEKRGREDKGKRRRIMARTREFMGMEFCAKLLISRR
jgi:hypothetical protein